MPKPKLLLLLVSALVVAACTPAPETAASITADRHTATIGQLAVGSQGAVVSVDGFATQAGLDVLMEGGNAIDAAIAVGFALAVTHPAAGNIGGGGFMTIYLADDSRFTTLDFRERAPLAATPDMYLGEDGRPVRGLNRRGWLAVGVPGTVAGFEKAHSQWGSLPWRRLVEPAVRMARDGILLNPYLARSLARVAESFEPFSASKEAFLRPAGSPYEIGDRLRQPDLAWSLEQIAESGAAAFYTGEIAQRLSDAMAANGGLISMEDLAAYESIERQPIRGTYRGYDVISMPPPSSGGTILVEMLNILENFDLGHEPNDPEAIHLMIEAMRQAYLDRAKHLGDADFVEVPIDKLTSKEYASELAAQITDRRARRSSDLGAEILEAPEPAETTHYSVIDASGNAVSTTYTIEAGYGSRAMAKGTGFLLNNEMSDFNSWPGVTDERGWYIGTQPNLIAPGKRMLSSMTPTIIARDGKPVMLVGSPGGKTIINTVLRVVVNVIDFDQALSDAVSSPRLHHQWMPDQVFLEPSFPAETIETLSSWGHNASASQFGLQGDAHCIFIYPDGARLAVADPRRSGAAAAY